MSKLKRWITIWTEPKATISEIVAENPKQALWWLSAILGFNNLMGGFQSVMLGMHINAFALILLALIIAPFWGYVSISVWGWIVSFTGKWIRGSGSFQEVRAAYAWSNVPMIVTIPLWFLLAVVFGPVLFSGVDEHALLSTYGAPLLYSVLMIRLAAGIWSIVIFINALAAVQKFSILRAIGNVLLAALIVLIVIFIGSYLLMRIANH